MTWEIITHNGFAAASHTQSPAPVCTHSTHAHTHARGRLYSSLLWWIEFTVPFKVWKKPSVPFLNCKRWVIIWPCIWFVLQWLI